MALTFKNISTGVTANGRYFSVADLLKAGSVTLTNVSTPITADGKVYGIDELEGQTITIGEGGNAEGGEEGGNGGQESKLKIIFGLGYFGNLTQPIFTISDFETKTETHKEYQWGEVPTEVQSARVNVSDLDSIGFGGHAIQGDLKIYATHDDYPNGGEYGDGWLIPGWSTTWSDLNETKWNDEFNAYEKVRYLYISDIGLYINIHFVDENHSQQPEQPEESTKVFVVRDSMDMNRAEFPLSWDGLHWSNYSIILPAGVNWYQYNVLENGMEVGDGWQPLIYDGTGEKMETGAGTLNGWAYWVKVNKPAAEQPDRFEVYDSTGVLLGKFGLEDSDGTWRGVASGFGDGWDRVDVYVDNDLMLSRNKRQFDRVIRGDYNLWNRVDNYPIDATLETYRSVEITIHYNA